MRKSGISKYAFLAVLSASLFLYPLLLSTQDISGAESNKGRVVEIRSGNLERFTDGLWRPLKKGNAVSFGDRLRTDKTALVIVELPKTGRFVIGPDSEIELGKQDKDFRANMARGEVWMKSNLPKGNKAAITT